MSDTDLNEMINTLVGVLLPGATERRQPRSHRYTVGGRQIDIAHDGQWVEIAEGGLGHAGVLAEQDWIAPTVGWRWAWDSTALFMLLKAIPDIRLRRATDPTIATQITDPQPYRPVSVMPPIRRGLSLVVDGDDLAEDLGDRVRDDSATTRPAWNR